MGGYDVKGGIVGEDPITQQHRSVKHVIRNVVIQQAEHGIIFKYVLYFTAQGAAV